MALLNRPLKFSAVHQNNLGKNIFNFDGGSLSDVVKSPHIGDFDTGIKFEVTLEFQRMLA